MIAPELMGHVAIPCKWNEILFSSRDVPWMSLQSSSQDSSQEADIARKEDRPSSYHFSNPCGDNPDEEKPSEDFSKPRTQRYHSKWKSRQDA